MKYNIFDKKIIFYQKKHTLTFDSMYNYDRQKIRVLNNKKKKYSRVRIFIQIYLLK